MGARCAATTVAGGSPFPGREGGQGVRSGGGVIMSRFVSASLRKSVADVTRRKGRTLLVTLGIFVGVFGLTVINSVEDTLVSAFAFTRGYQTTQPDFQLTVDRLDSALLPTLRGVANVKTVQYTSLL